MRGSNPTGAASGPDRAFLYCNGTRRLWVADITFVATWRGPVYVALAIDVFSRMIV
jgi:transposase InsO family protein